MLITYINCCAHNSKRSYSGSRYCAMEFKKQKMGKQRKKGEKEKKWFFSNVFRRTFYLCRFKRMILNDKTTRRQ